MLQHGVNPNFIYYRTANGSSRREVVTPLHIAVDLGNVDIVDTLLAANADCNVRDHNSDTPLHVAVVKADVVMTK
jgi:ankyrin repeat protein